MELRLVRETFTAASTIGRLWIDGLFECFCLEDVVHDGPKIPGHTAIPYGRYQIIIDFSSRFGRALPRLLNVPGFTGIRIHPGNDAGDSSGCILVGRTKGHDFIGESRAAFSVLFLKLNAALQKEKIFITIEKDGE